MEIWWNLNLESVILLRYSATETQTTYMLDLHIVFCVQNTCMWDPWWHDNFTRHCQVRSCCLKLLCQGALQCLWHHNMILFGETGVFCHHRVAIKMDIVNETSGDLRQNHVL